MREIQRTLDAEKEYGVYLLSIRSVGNGYVVVSAEDRVSVNDVTAHGQHIGTPEHFETECVDYEITDGGVFNLKYGSPSGGRDGSRTGGRGER